MLQNFSYENELACMVGVLRGGKGERRAREAREDRTREDRGWEYFLPLALMLTFLPPFLRPATQAKNEPVGRTHHMNMWD